MLRRVKKDSEGKTIESKEILSPEIHRLEDMSTSSMVNLIVHNGVFILEDINNFTCSFSKENYFNKRSEIAMISDCYMAKHFNQCPVEDSTKPNGYDYVLHGKNYF